MASSAFTPSTFSAPMPPGTIVPFSGGSVPEGWLLCDGAPVSRSVYSRLYQVLLTTYGSGDGSTSFNVPDMRGVYARGAGTNGTANYGGVTGHTPAGGSLATKVGQKTAKNGLSASASGSNGSSGVSVSGNKSQMDGSTGNMSANSSHSHGFTDSTSNPVMINGGGFLTGGLYAGGGSQFRYAGGISSTDTNHFHSWSFGAATFNASGSAGAQSWSGTTTIAGDTETTPAALSLNYIIKT